MYKRIRELREDHDIKQTEIAKFLNMSQNGYSQCETGTNKVSIDILEKLAIFYNTSVDYIIGLTDEVLPYKRAKKFKHKKIPD